MERSYDNLEIIQHFLLINTNCDLAQEEPSINQPDRNKTDLAQDKCSRDQFTCITTEDKAISQPTNYFVFCFEHNI